VRFPNILTGKIQWLTIGYVPIIKPDSNDAAEKKWVRVLRDTIFQRCFAVLLHRLIPVSEYGMKMRVPGEEGMVLAVPRLVLYAADQPEERHALGLKLSGCRRPCSHCMVHRNSAACRGRRADVREVLLTVEAQIEDVEALEDGAGSARMMQIEGDTSIVAIIPALAAVHGLGTGPCCLYRIFGFDMLHVSTASLCDILLEARLGVYLGMGGTRSRRDSDRFISSLDALLHTLVGNEAWGPPRARTKDSITPEGAVQGWPCAVWVGHRDHHRNE